MSRTLVIGFGTTGRAVTGAIVAGGGEVVVSDDRLDTGLAAAIVAAGAQPVSGPPEEVLRGVDVVVPSPGVPVGHPVLRAAAAAGLPLRSEVELAWRRLAARPEPRPSLVAVTGTNGKTTVTTLVAEMLAASGRRVATGGNIGMPLLEAVAGDVDVVVAEVSSFQLHFTDGWRPAVSCWLNLADDHLDWHPDMAHYAAAKARIWANQGPGDTVVVNADDPAVLTASRDVPAGVRVVTFGSGGDLTDASAGAASADPRQVRLLGPGGVDLLAGRVMTRSLPHDRANALAAAAVATAAGATADGVADALAAWRPLGHRVELVAQAGGVTFYDDSKATTPASVLAATAGMGSVVLIAGGRNKGLDLSPLASTAPPVHAVVAIGEAAGEVESAFAGRVPVRRAASMAEAVDLAIASARPGDAVVLSPGCASFDWYASYAARGDDFAACVRDRIAALPTPDTAAGATP